MKTAKGSLWNRHRFFLQVEKGTPSTLGTPKCFEGIGWETGRKKIGFPEWGSGVSWRRSLKWDLLLTFAVADIWGFLLMNPYWFLRAFVKTPNISHATTTGLESAGEKQLNPTIEPDKCPNLLRTYVSSFKFPVSLNNSDRPSLKIVCHLTPKTFSWKL